MTRKKEKILSGEPDPSFIKYFDKKTIFTPDEDFKEEVENTNVLALMRQKWRERKGYPHPYDELDPTDVPYKPKKAQFPL